MQERIDTSETRQCRIILPGLLNDNGILFGGTAMQWMDEVAYITATRFSGMRMVTVAVDKVNFKLPVAAGKIVEIIGRIKNVKCVKIEVGVELYMEDKYAGVKQLAMDALFTFAAVDANHKPVMIDYRKKCTHREEEYPVEVSATI